MIRVGYRMLGTESTEPNIFKYRVPITKFTRTGTGIEKILLQLHVISAFCLPTGKIIEIYITLLVFYGILEPK